MQQYHDLLWKIKQEGTVKPAAREGMPSSLSLFGAQFRHDLSKGFPLLTTKKMYWKGIVTELLWMLRGDTNIKYLVDNNVHIWDEDAYNYYLKTPQPYHFSFEDFIGLIKDGTEEAQVTIDGYTLGDCGYQYGKVWRRWSTSPNKYGEYDNNPIDQIKNLIEGLKNHPESRRHIVTAIDPAHDKDLALYWCHALFQFNCRPLTLRQRVHTLNSGVIFGPPYIYLSEGGDPIKDKSYHDKVRKDMNEMNVPKYILDCHLYQRSADAFLGVPFNIASYALLTHILCKICNMIPGELITSYGDIHIYENHMDAVNEQLSRSPRDLPILKYSIGANDLIENYVDGFISLDGMFQQFEYQSFQLEGYNPYPAIKGELTTGMKK